MQVTIDGQEYEKVEKGKTHVFAILDRSGSMAGLEKDTIGGYNSFIKDLKKTDARVTLTIFDTEIEIPYADKPVKNVPELTGKVYYPRGMTALIDAVCKTINENKARVKRGEKAIVLIITDGMENASKEYTSQQMKKLIKGLDAKKNWTFTYLGANQDAWAVSNKWGFDKGNVATYQATSRGTAAAWGSMSVNTVQLASSEAMNSKKFYEDDKDKLENAQ